MPTRRTFIKTGLAGSALLALAAAFHRQLDRAGKDVLVAGHPLGSALPRVVRAVAPVMLRGSFPESGPARAAALERSVAGVAEAVAALSAAAQREVAELFALLDLAPTRIAVAGLGSDWEHAEPAEIEAFLRRWRSSGTDLLKSGYLALHDLVLGAWYADPSTWAEIRYPGPPVLVK